MVIHKVFACKVLKIVNAEPLIPLQTYFLHHRPGSASFSRNVTKFQTGPCSQ